MDEKRKVEADEREVEREISPNMFFFRVRGPRGQLPQIESISALGSSMPFSPHKKIKKGARHFNA